MEKDLALLLEELKNRDFFKENELCIIGCSTSEIIGESIGSVGSMDVAEKIYIINSRQLSETLACRLCIKDVNTLIEQ